MQIDLTRTHCIQVWCAMDDHKFRVRQPRGQKKSGGNPHFEGVSILDEIG